MPDPPLLKVGNLIKHYPLGGSMFSRPRAWIKAVDGVSFTVSKGESFGLVGESGCGKTTLGRLILRLIEPTSGYVELNGKNIFSLKGAELSSLRPLMQIIFQDPYSSLDPRMKVGAIVTEPLRASQGLTRKQRQKVAARLLKEVGLREDALNKYPHEFSGGQRQRIGIARALCVRPELIVADEPVSALDVSIQAQVINLMGDLKEEFNLSYVFISHDLSVVEHICDRIAVMYLGVFVEMGPTGELILSHLHPYTEALLAASLIPDPHRKVDLTGIVGEVPNPLDPPSGCLFHPRCQYRLERCQIEKPGLMKVKPDHFVACWLIS